MRWSNEFRIVRLKDIFHLNCLDFDIDRLSLLLRRESFNVFLKLGSNSPYKNGSRRALNDIVYNEAISIYAGTSRSLSTMSINVSATTGIQVTIYPTATIKNARDALSSEALL